MNEMYARLIKAIQLRDSTDEHAILRAVLEAMREPTEEMIELVRDSVGVHAYKSIIDEILK